MTDRELLELAAKAAGIKLSQSYDFQSGFRLVEPASDWNPLEDDGDALRLAVQLGIRFEDSSLLNGTPTIAATNGDVGVHEPTGHDRLTATRRTIVRAAAEIGKELK